MILFVVTEDGSRSIHTYLAGRGGVIADRLRVVLYSELARMDRLPLGTWVFAEQDRLDQAHRDLAVLAAERLDEAGTGARVLNDPRKVRLRLDLLRAAHEAGINEHRAWAATDIRFDTRTRAHDENSWRVRADSLRYPVFIRHANDHLGSLSELIDTPRNLVTALAFAVASGIRRQELAVVEFCDTQDDDGLYRKYAAYNVGGRILPSTLECSREWMVKWQNRILDRERADEEMRYCETNPHDAWIREMFCLARIDYGRIDYSVRAGVPRLWEINTHPWIGGGPLPLHDEKIVTYRSLVAPTLATFFEGFRSAWVAVDTPAGEAESVPLNIPDTLRRALERSRRQRRSAEHLSAFLNFVERQRGGYRMTHAVRRALTPIIAARLRAGPR
jgi:hypothetical protein